MSNTLIESTYTTLATELTQTAFKVETLKALQAKVDVLLANQPEVKQKVTDTLTEETLRLTLIAEEFAKIFEQKFNEPVEQQLGLGQLDLAFA